MPPPLPRAAPFAAAGVVVALCFFFFVPFSPDTGTGAKLFFSAIIGAFAAYGLWSLWGIPALVADLWNLARRPKRRSPSSAPIHHKGPLPELSPSRQADVRRVVRVMAEHGVFAPEAPDPALLYAGVADIDESVKPDTILSILDEVSYYHPDADPAAWTPNLAMHDSKAEQDEAAQIADLVRLAGGGLAVSDIRIEHGAEVERRIPVTIAMTVNGEAVTLGYAGNVKYLSTHIHHALAARLDAANTGRRFAWLWTDQGAWISALPAGAVEAMNAALKLKPQSRCCWEWVSNAAPMGAGETI
jgi:hypothetical protein